uniref:uncharacterized protein LOC101292359 n=1 Tax=Fragaria vesca subsp. vesca TaxID=101020 RepID=UPI0005C803E4|nr:PREDICTED: uncharacterized protein LOC101292359 [Fragaria vesca subsp. vesca]XP_011458175.1 PREDICTED: uncharacterized protein LOC101292359 [Fragaria vesca subsp. vesca]
MSASTNGRALAGLSLDDVLTPRAATAASPKQPPPAPAIPASISGRTLLDIIRDEEPKSYKALIGKKDKKPWKTFKDRLRLKKASAAWASSILVPTSDVSVHRYNNNHRHQLQGYSHSRARCNSIRYVTPEPQPMAEPGDNAAATSRPSPSFTRRSSVRFASPVDDVDSPRRRLETAISEERSLSAREAVAAQHAAEAAAAAAEEAAAEGEGGEGSGASSSSSEKASGEQVAEQPVRMSLMDLLEETDRQMGLEGGRYTMDDEDEEEEEEEEPVAAAAAEEKQGGEEGGGVEYSCCVCMVRHKGSAFIPCGHTFCRMCSRELWVQRGNCPLCNNFILEILDIF